jgi:hypothetical protein
MVGVTMIVYNFEHSHDLRDRDTPGREKETDRSKELRLRRKHTEQVGRYIEALLVRGVGIRDVTRMLGANTRRCRDIILASRGETTTTTRRRIARHDFLTKSNVVEALEMMQGMETEGLQGGSDEEKEEEEEEVGEMEDAKETNDMEEVQEVQEEVVVEKEDKLQVGSKAQWQTDILQRALQDLYRLKASSGLDPELEENDDRLQEPTSSSDSNDQQLAASRIYTHPNLKVDEF